MSERIGVIRRVLLPADDLSLEFERAGYYGLGDDIKLGLSLLYGIGPNQPRLITVDDAGRLILGAPPVGTLVGAVNIADSTGPIARVAVPSDGFGGGVPNLEVMSVPMLQNGAAFDRQRQASSTFMGNTQGVGAALVSPPGMWSVINSAGVGNQSTATKAAAGAGVRHICTGIVVAFGAVAAPVATFLTWNLRDGTTGVGTVLAQGLVAVPAAVFQSDPIVITGITIPGTAATAMTLEFSAALANLAGSVTLLGFDAV